jgi:hypothetical protein
MRTIAISCAVIALCGALAACAQPKVIDGKEYQPYGLFTSDTYKDQAIRYEVVWGNVVWSILLSETLIVPVYFFGFSLFQPIDKKPAATVST